MKKIKLGLVLVLCFALISCSSGVKTSLTPEEHVMEAIELTFGTGSLDMTADMDIEFDLDALIDGVSGYGTYDTEEQAEQEEKKLSNFDVQVNYKLKSDLENDQLDYKLNYIFGYDNKTLLDMDLFANLKQLGFAVNNFYDGVFVFEYQPVIQAALAQEGLEGIADIDFTKYFDIIMAKYVEYSEQLDGDKYDNILKEHLKVSLSEGVQEELTLNINGEEVKEQVLTYEYSYDMLEMIGMLYDIIELAKEDEQVKTFYKDLVNALLDELESSGDYQVLEMDEYEIDYAREMLESDFDAYWNEMFDGLLYEFNTAELDVQTLVELDEIYKQMNVKLSINKDSLLRNISVTLDHSEVKYNVAYTVNSIGDDVVIEYNEDKFIKVFDFVDFENETLVKMDELDKILKDFILGAIDEIQNGEGFEALFADLGQYENEIGLGVMSMNMGMNMMKDELENINLAEQLNDSLFYSFDYDYDYDNDYGYDDVVELTKLGLITIDETDMDAVLSSIAQDYALEYTQMVAQDEDYYALFEKMHADGANMVFIEDERLKEAAIAFADQYDEFKVVAMFEEGDDYFPFNMAALEVYDEEPAFAAGYVAALTSETGKIGFVSGIDDSMTKNIAYGFENGALYANENITVIKYNADTDDDVSVVDTIATQIKNDGVDVVYHDAGAVGNALIDAAGQYGFKVIGNSLYGLDNENLLTTHVVNAPEVATSIVDDYYYGIFNPYVYVSLGYNQIFFSRDQLTEEVSTALDDLIKEVEYGSLYIEAYYGD